MKNRDKIEVKVKLFEPFPRQRDILQCALDDSNNTKFINIQAGRQVGKTTLMENVAVYWLLKNHNEIIAFILPSVKQCLKVFNKILLKIEEVSQKTKTLTINRNTMSVTNTITNSKLIFYSAEMRDNLRGNTWDRGLIDECSFIDDDTYNAIIKPCFFVKGKKIIQASSPKFKNWFFDACELGRRKQTKHNNYRTFKLRTHDNPLIAREEIEQYKLSMPPSIYLNEIEGEFVDNNQLFNIDSHHFVELENIADRTKKYINEWIYCGLDIGINDYTVLTIFTREKQMIDVLRINKMSYTKQIEIIDQFLKKYPKRKGYIEANNGGSALYEFNKETFKGFELFTTTTTSKKEIVEDFIYLFNSNECKLLNNPDLKSELNTFTMIYNPATRSVKYSARNGFTDDIIMSASIGLKCVKDKRLNTSNSLPAFFSN